MTITAMIIVKTMRRKKKKNRHPEGEKKRGIRLATLIHLIHVDPNF
jgi:hypothetical protein